MVHAHVLENLAPILTVVCWVWWAVCLTWMLGGSILDLSRRMRSKENASPAPRAEDRERAEPHGSRGGFPAYPRRDTHALVMSADARDLVELTLQDVLDRHVDSFLALIACAAKPEAWIGHYERDEDGAIAGARRIGRLGRLLIQLDDMSRGAVGCAPGTPAYGGKSPAIFREQ